MISKNAALLNEAKRQELSADVEAFVNSGGKIQWCDSSWNVGSECDAQTLARRRFSMSIKQNTFGKDDKSRMVRT